MENTPKTPAEERNPAYHRARQEMAKDVQSLVSLLMMELEHRAGESNYQPVRNIYYERAHEFMLDLVLEKLHELR